VHVIQMKTNHGSNSVGFREKMRRIRIAMRNANIYIENQIPPKNALPCQNPWVDMSDAHQAFPPPRTKYNIPEKKKVTDASHEEWQNIKVLYIEIGHMEMRYHGLAGPDQNKDEI
jgi:hypothetical protein